MVVRVYARLFVFPYSLLECPDLMMPQILHYRVMVHSHDLKIRFRKKDY